MGFNIDNWSWFKMMALMVGVVFVVCGIGWGLLLSGGWLVWWVFQHLHWG